MGQWEMDLSWHADASCRDLNVEDFYSDSDDNSGERKRYEYHKRNELRKVCAKCPVVEQCLNHALKYEHHGFWRAPRTRTAGSFARSSGLLHGSPVDARVASDCGSSESAKQRERQQS